MGDKDSNTKIVSETFEESREHEDTVNGKHDKTDKLLYFTMYIILIAAINELKL